MRCHATIILFAMVLLLSGCERQPGPERDEDAVVSGNLTIELPDTIADTRIYLARARAIDSNTIALPLPIGDEFTPRQMLEGLRKCCVDSAAISGVYPVPDSVMQRYVETDFPHTTVLFSPSEALGLADFREFALVKQPIREFPAALFRADSVPQARTDRFYLSSPALYRRYGTKLDPVAFDTLVFTKRLVDTLGIGDSIHEVRTAAMQTKAGIEVYAAVSWQGVPAEVSDYFVIDHPSSKVIAAFSGDSLTLLQRLPDRSEFYMVDLALLPLEVNGSPVLAITNGFPRTDHLFTSFMVRQNGGFVEHRERIEGRLTR